MKIKDRVYWVGSGAVGLSADGDCHTYLIEGDDALALVDCGMAFDPKKILERVESDGLDVAKIRYCFLTHSHFDHAGGCEALRKMGIHIVGSVEADKILQVGAQEYYNLDSNIKDFKPWCAVPISQLDIIASHHQKFDLGRVEVEALETPGHSPDSMCFIMTCGEDKNAFTGDQVFYKGMINVLAPQFSDHKHFVEGMLPLRGQGIKGLFPGHLMWVIDGGQKHIDIAIDILLRGHMPVNKPFS